MTGTPNREGNFEQKARNFDAHAHKLAGTAQQVALAGGTNNKRIVEGINNAAQQVRSLLYLVDYSVLVDCYVYVCTYNYTDYIMVCTVFVFSR